MNELQRELNTLMENAQKVDAPYDKDYDKINALDNKIEHPESLKFSFSRQNIKIKIP